jgi:hypothetical protein
MIFLLALGWLWAAPFSLLGALLALVTLSKPYAIRGPAVVCRMGPVMRWAFKTFAPRFNVAAVTWSCVIFTWHDLKDRDTLTGYDADRDRLTIRHELVHVRQAMIFGPLFPVLYLGSMLVAWAQGGRAYRDCWFERQAYREELLP